MSSSGQTEGKTGSSSTVSSLQLLCKYYAKGTCTKGDRCEALHVLARSTSGSSGVSQAIQHVSAPGGPSMAPRVMDIKPHSLPVTPKKQAVKGTVCSFFLRGECLRVNCPFEHQGGSSVPSSSQSQSGAVQDLGLYRTSTTTENIRSEGPLNTPQPRHEEGKKTCPFFIQGNCRHGGKCKLNHATTTASPPVSVSPPHHKSKQHHHQQHHQQQHQQQQQQHQRRHQQQRQPGSTSVYGEDPHGLATSVGREKDNRRHAITKDNPSSTPARPVNGNKHKEPQPLPISPAFQSLSSSASPTLTPSLSLLSLIPPLGSLGATRGDSSPNLDRTPSKMTEGSPMICRPFMNGKCRSGAQCRYIHNEEGKRENDEASRKIAEELDETLKIQYVSKIEDVNKAAVGMMEKRALDTVAMIADANRVIMRRSSAGTSEDKQLKRVHDGERRGIADVEHKNASGKEGSQTDDPTLLNLLTAELELSNKQVDSVRNFLVRVMRDLPATELPLFIEREMRRVASPLPALAFRDRLYDFLEKEGISPQQRCLVLQGETGSGKSTQVPQYAADYFAIRNAKRKRVSSSIEIDETPYRVYCVQPRPLAAKALASRVYSEYTGRNIDPNKAPSVCVYGAPNIMKSFQGKRARIVYLTEGMMLNIVMRAYRWANEAAAGDKSGNGGDTDDDNDESGEDDGEEGEGEGGERKDEVKDAMAKGKKERNKGVQNPLAHVACIILDEAHERTLAMDTLMGLLHQNHVAWNHVKFVVTSATIDLERFTKYFNLSLTDSINVPGRVFPVSVLYEPLRPGSKELEEVDGLSILVAQRALTIYRAGAIEHESKGGEGGNVMAEEGGDILAFLPSYDAVDRAVIYCHKELRRLGHANKAIVHALHGGLEAEEQREVLNADRHGRRRLIFSTGIAETSLTIDGITHVLDTGLRRTMVLDPITRMSSLRTIPCSQSSVKQRTGRAGRTRPGVCYRLYTKEAYEAMEHSTTPDIHQQPLSQTVLALAAMGIDAATFPWMDGPSVVNIAAAKQELIDLKAISINENGNMTCSPLGHFMAQAQIAPQDASIIYHAYNSGLYDAGLTLVAIIQHVSSIWQRPDNKSNWRELNERKEKVIGPEGEMVTLWYIYEAWSTTVYKGSEMTKGQKEAWCDERCVSMDTLSRVYRRRVDLFQVTRYALQKALGDSPAPRQVTAGDIQALFAVGYFQNVSHATTTMREGGKPQVFLYSFNVGKLVSGEGTDVNPDLTKWWLYTAVKEIGIPRAFGCSPVDIQQLNTLCPRLYKECCDKLASVPVHEEVVELGALYNHVLGHKFHRLPEIEKTHGVFPVINSAESKVAVFGTQSSAKSCIKALLALKDEQCTRLKREKCVNEYMGGVRAIVKAGYLVEGLMFNSRSFIHGEVRVMGNGLKAVKGSRDTENNDGDQVEASIKRLLGISPLSPDVVVLSYQSDPGPTKFENKLATKADTPTSNQPTMKAIARVQFATPELAHRARTALAQHPSLVLRPDNLVGTISAVPTRYRLASYVRLEWSIYSSSGNAIVDFASPSSANLVISHGASFLARAFRIPGITVSRTPSREREEKRTRGKKGVNQGVSKYDERRPYPPHIRFPISVTGLPLNVDEYELTRHLSQLVTPASVKVIRRQAEGAKLFDLITQWERQVYPLRMAAYSHGGTTEDDLTRLDEGVAALLVYATIEADLNAIHQRLSNLISTQTARGLPLRCRMEHTLTATLHSSLMEVPYIRDVIGWFEQEAAACGVHVSSKSKLPAMIDYGTLDIEKEFKSVTSPDVTIEYKVSSSPAISSSSNSIGSGRSVATVLHQIMKGLQGEIGWEPLPLAPAAMKLLYTRCGRYLLNELQNKVNGMDRNKFKSDIRKGEKEEDAKGMPEQGQVEGAAVWIDSASGRITVFGSAEGRRRMIEGLVSLLERFQGYDAVEYQVASHIRLNSNEARLGLQEIRKALEGEFHYELTGTARRIEVLTTQAKHRTLQLLLAHNNWLPLEHKTLVSKGVDLAKLRTGPQGHHKHGGRAGVDVEKKTCSICQVDCEPAEFWSWTLCSHGCCDGCAAEQIGHVTSTNQPVECYECKIPIPISDIRNAKLTEEQRNRFISRAVAQFCATNQDTLAWCPTPGCGQIIPRAVANTEAGMRYGCESCHRTYCLPCTFACDEPIEPHVGRMTCQERQSSLSRFANEAIDKVFTLRRPCCGRAILDWDGCPLVTCTECSKGLTRTYFCGLCLNVVFNDSTAGHAHALTKCTFACKDHWNRRKNEAHQHYRQRKLSELLRGATLSPADMAKLKQILLPLLQEYGLDFDRALRGI